MERRCVEVGNAGHLDLDRHRNLALNLFGAAAGPLRDDLDVVVGYVGIGFDGQVAERDDSPAVSTKIPPSTIQRFLKSEINKRAQHYRPPLFQAKMCLSTRASDTISFGSGWECGFEANITSQSLTPE